MSELNEGSIEMYGLNQVPEVPGDLFTSEERRIS